MKLFLQGAFLYSIAFAMSLAFVNCAKQGEIREPQSQSQSVEFQDYARCFKGELCGSHKGSVCYSPESYFILPEDKEILCLKEGIILEDIEYGQEN